MVKDVHEFLAALPSLRPEAGSITALLTRTRATCPTLRESRASQENCWAAFPDYGSSRWTTRRVAVAPAERTRSHSATSRSRLLKRKMRAVADTEADVLATANPGCALQLEHGAQRYGVPVKVRYVTDILDESYRLADTQ